MFYPLSFFLSLFIFVIPTRNAELKLMTLRLRVSQGLSQPGTPLSSILDKNTFITTWKARF